MPILALAPHEACARMRPLLGERGTAFDPESMAQALHGWDFLDVDGAIVMRQGDEIHVAAPPGRQWFTRRNARAVLGQMLEKFGRLTTSVADDNPRGKAFVRRVGFHEVGSSMGCMRYEMTRCVHAE